MRVLVMSEDVTRRLEWGTNRNSSHGLLLARNGEMREHAVIGRGCSSYIVRRSATQAEKAKCLVERPSKRGNNPE
jgi:hypothetical protein